MEERSKVKLGKRPADGLRRREPCTNLALVAYESANLFVRKGAGVFNVQVISKSRTRERSGDLLVHRPVVAVPMHLTPSLNIDIGGNCLF